MTTFKNLVLAFTMLSASAAAQAADDNRVPPAGGKLKRSISFMHAGTSTSLWGQPLTGSHSHSLYYTGYKTVSARFNGSKLRQQDLQGRYDVPLPAS